MSARNGTVVLRWPRGAPGLDVTVVTVALAAALRAAGFEIDDERVDWRVLMYRRDATRWTQVYTGLTRRLKAERSRLAVTGPESEAVRALGFADALPRGELP